jgi:PKD repeat protein
MPEGVNVRQIASIILVLSLLLSGLSLVATPVLAAFPPPQADAGPDQVGEVKEPVTLDGSGSRDFTPDEKLTFRWDLDASNGTNDVDARGEVIDVVYTESGIYTATLTVDDGDFEDSDTVRIQITDPNQNLPPKAIIVKPLPGVYNRSEPIDFEGQGFDANNDPLTGRWEFGDDKTSTHPITTHSYSTDGPKFITWTVSDRSSNNTARTVIMIGESVDPQVSRRPDAVILVSDTNVSVGERVRFDGTNSSDPDDDELTYEWDFDLSDGLQTESTDPIVWHTFNDTGEFTVSLQVRDGNQGGWDIATEPITVTEEPNEPPNANAGNDAEVQVGVPLSFRGTATDPDDDNITSYMWNFGDGSTWEDNRSGETNHTYREPGTYTATFTVEDEHGETGSDTRTVHVSPPPDMPPTANAGEDMVVMEGDTVRFSGRGTDDFGIAKYEWDFNADNIWDYESQFSGDATWVYETPGVFTAIFRVTDKPRPGVSGPGQTDEDSLIVTVNQNQDPKAKIVVSTLFVQAGETVKFNQDSEDPEGSRLSSAWDLDGDGAIDSNAAKPSWTYRREGDYQVTLTVTDDFGQSDTDTVTMQVSQTYAVTLDIASPLRDLDPGDRHDFRATVENNGNGDDQFRITLSGKNSNWATVDKSLLNLNATERQTITITVTVPASGLSTDDALVTVTASSNYGGASDAGDIEVGVKQKFGLTATIDSTSNSVSIKKGESKEDFAKITITNLGNGPDSFRISFSGDITGYLRSSTPKVDLQPGESRDVTLSITVVETAPSGKASGVINIASTRSNAKQVIEFSVDIEGGDGGGPVINLDNRLLMIIGGIVILVVVVSLVAGASRKKRPGNSVKKPSRG